ncbi:MAG TPA: TetR/AcrR family transcriptional regulator [Allosphingosinicella sp.]|nr:TetR/AcrR family transcriptional regulator [Allosphingosinicella sp.]
MRKESLPEGCCDALDAPRKKAATRIFETALELFYQRGIRAVGVDEIVCQAGVTKPSLYRSFESKDALVAACLESFAAEGMAEFDEKLEAAGPDPMARLRAIIAHMAGELEEPGFHGCLMSNAAVEFRDDGHPGRLVIEACKAKFRERLRGIIDELGAEEPETLTDGLILLIEGAYSAHIVFGKRGPANAFVLTAERLVASHMQA